jgi:hypothetical protein
MKTKLNWNWKLYWNLGVFLVLLERSLRVRLNRVYFTNFRAKVWKMLIFEWTLLPEIQKKLQKFGLEGKISWPLNVFTLPNFKTFNSENVKNKEYIHTWANGTSYISYHEQTSGYLWPSDTVKSPKSECGARGGGEQKKIKLSNIFGWFWVCSQRYKSMITIVYFIFDFIASFGTIFLRKVATFYYGRSPLCLQTKNLRKIK